ncbi:MAG: hypothetical protein ACI8QZ_002155 [Chlamydiales bacterium]|jgi:uncharacterized protein (DUF1800 family)
MHIAARTLGRMAGLALLFGLALSPTVAGEPQAEGESQEQTKADRWSKSPPLWVEENWDARKLEHLLNRAAFGASKSDVDRWLGHGPRAVITYLLKERPVVDPFLNDQVKIDRKAMRAMSPEERRIATQRIRARNRDLFQSYLTWWFDEMVKGRSPLRERMVLFWHGFITSSITEVQRAHLMVQQSELLRGHALGSYADILRDALRDPALLIYLNNNSNEKGHPNENLAREVMELFSLGEGNYTEQDVLEAARALTGRGTDNEYGYRFEPRRHDFGEKAILGVEGRLDADDLVDILIAQPACARHVARRLIEYLEGATPSDERLEIYADLLRRHDYQMRPMLRRLFLDPEFYRDEVLGARVGSPVDYLVGTCRRLQIEPPATLLAIGTSLAGQSLLDPPSVKGWDGGETWINTSSLMTRGNLAGLLLGTLVDDINGDGPGVRARRRLGASAERVVDEDVFVAMDEMKMEMDGGDRHSRADGKSRLDRLTRLVSRVGYSPRMHFTARFLRAGIEGEEAIVDTLLEELLAIVPPQETRLLVLAYLTSEAKARGIEPGKLLESGSESEYLLRDVAHLILSLPEANLG